MLRGRRQNYSETRISRKDLRMATASPNILVVEDDRETRALIAKYQRTNACNVTTANDGREMARAMADRRVDLLILDVMLPGEDGLTSSGARRISGSKNLRFAPSKNICHHATDRRP